MTFLEEVTVRPIRVALVAIAAAGLAACAPRGPVLDTGEKPSGVGGTIAGIVRAAGSNEPLSGRKVTAIDVSSSSRFETSTAVNGGYTIKVPRGTYRIEVELRAGETLAEQPRDTEINSSDVDAQRDFSIRGPGRTPR